MTATSPRAFALSATLHAAVVLLLVLAGWATRSRSPDTPTILELVAGDGDNYMATEAPALGDPNSIKLDIPEPAISKAPASPVQPAPQPVVEKATPTVTKAPEEIPDFTKMVKQKAAITQIRKEANDKLAQKRAEKKEREEAAKRQKEEAAKKAKEDAAQTRKMTKAEFDKLNKTSKSTTPSKTSGGTVKVAKIDTKGILAGVQGGSTANKIGGAGGTALTRAEGEAVDLYTALLARKIKDELDERPGVGAGLTVEVEIRILTDGTIRGFKILRSSGSAEFDDAVRETFAKLKMPPRPKGLSELQRFPIRGVE
jgi:TonB family C-terminal domain